MRRLQLPQIYLVLLVAISAISIIIFTLNSVNIFQNVNQCHCKGCFEIQPPNQIQISWPAETAQPRYTATCSNLPKNLFQVAEFKFIQRSNDSCAGNLNRKGDLIVIVVHSGIYNTRKRDVIRSTWGSVRRFKSWAFELVFVLGSLKDAHSFDGPVEPESPRIPLDIHERDIVIGDFIDSYRNLTLKHLVAYKWVGEYCPHAKYILKVDDDVHIDIFHLTQIIEESELNEQHGFPGWSIIGNLMRGYGPERVTDSKAVVSLTEYDGDKYPDYVSGLVYLIKTEAACKIFASHTTREFLWIDDVFVTGILRDAVGLHIKGINSEYFFAPLLQGSALSEWYYSYENDNLPPYTIILDSPDFGSNIWERFGRVWAKTLRSYKFRPGYGFNEF